MSKSALNRIFWAHLLETISTSALNENEQICSKSLIYRCRLVRRQSDALQNASWRSAKKALTHIMDCLRANGEKYVCPEPGTKPYLHIGHSAPRDKKVRTQRPYGIDSTTSKASLPILYACTYISKFFDKNSFIGVGGRENEFLLPIILHNPAKNV